MVVHILAVDDREFSINYHVARKGFEYRGAEINIFQRHEFDELRLQKNDIVIAGISLTHKAFAELGLSVPSLPAIPEALAPFAGRMTWRSTIGDVRQRVSRGDPIFFKPAPSQPKLFTGLVANRVSDLVETASLDDATPIDCSEIVSFRSEYRCFVLNGEVIGVRPYKGDPLLFPESGRIRKAVAAWSDAPVAWALDMGVTSANQTLLVEVNDSYALGSYGLPPARYAAMIEARWAELSAQRIQSQT